MNPTTQAALAVGATAGVLALAFSAPLWVGVLAFAGAGYVTQKAIQNA